jgi:GNAT superfamily N-acetyltransferase
VTTIRELDASRDAAGCDAVIASLPDFFGVESGRADCARAVRSERGAVAIDDDDRVIGFATWTAHRDDAAEITWAAVHRDARNQRLGRRIIGAVEDQARAAGVAWMTVMTVSPNDARPETYTPTRHFWQRVVGYSELRDFDIWDSNLAVLMVKRLD